MGRFYKFGLIDWSKFKFISKFQLLNDGISNPPESVLHCFVKRTSLIGGIIIVPATIVNDIYPERTWIGIYTIYKGI